MNKTCKTCKNGWLRTEADKRRNGQRKHTYECFIDDKTPYKLPGESCEQWEADE